MTTKRLLTPMLLLAALLATGAAFAQNQIVGVTPSSAAPGTSSLVVTFDLDTDTPSAPPAGVLPASATIGTISGSSLTHTTQYVVTATFDIPAAEAVGTKDCVVTWTPPGGGTLTFSATGAFTVASATAPPAIIRQPTAKIVLQGRTVSFAVAASGTAPLTFQWSKDGTDIGGATDPHLVIAAPLPADAGSYACNVSNAYGSAASDAATLTVVTGTGVPYPVLSSMQAACYDATKEIPCPASGAAFYGQDAQQTRYTPAFTVSTDGLTVYEAVSGLTWQRSPDRNGDGTIDATDKLSYADAVAYPATLNAATFGGFDDWRLPTIKELYSLIDFRGTDPSSFSGSDTSVLDPFIDTSVFAFAYGDTGAGERIIDAQFASSTPYVSTTMGGFFTDFGVNFADGRIKGYGTTDPVGNVKMFYVISVRGGSYGVNDFVDQGDGTVVDQGTGLQWFKTNLGTYDWQSALDTVQALNASSTNGYDDWRLPTIKELQSLLDYTRSPDTTSSAAIDPAFTATAITNEACATDYPFYWASTTHADWQGNGSSGDYMAFGRALGYMNGSWVDAHGAGAQRSDPKSGALSSYTAQDCGYYNSIAPQGDNVRIQNYIRPVRGGNGYLLADFAYAPTTIYAGAPVSLSATASGSLSPYVYEWSFDDATTDTGAAVEHTFTAGVRTVTLTVHSALLPSSESTVVVTKSFTVVSAATPAVDARFEKNASDPTQIDLTYQTACAGDEAIVVYGNLGDFSGYTGGLTSPDTASGSTTVDASGVDLVWFNVVWVKHGIAGHPGWANDGSSSTQRTWNAAGHHPDVVGDDHSVTGCQ